MKRRNRFLITGLVGCAAFAGTIAILYGADRALSGASLTVINDSGIDLNDVSVQVWQHRIEMGHIERGSQKRIRVRNYLDSAWTVRGTWADGDELNISVGYVTHGMNFDDRITIQDKERLSYESDTGFFFRTRY